jgi:hypothetical protein
MSKLIAPAKTSLQGEEVIVRSIGARYEPFCRRRLS